VSFIGGSFPVSTPIIRSGRVEPPPQLSTRGGTSPCRIVEDAVEKIVERPLKGHDRLPDVDELRGVRAENPHT